MDLSQDDVRAVLSELVPTIAWEKVPSGGSLTEAGLDSLDKANVFLRLEERSGLKIPDEEYDTLDSIDGVVEYIRSRKTA
jgi:acyl carrier protein